MTPTESAAKELNELADNAYCDYANSARQPLCCGWQAKVATGKFGQAEYDAHVACDRQFGRHLAFREAAAILTKHFASATTGEGSEKQGGDERGNPTRADYEALENSGVVPSRSIQRLSTPADQPLPTFEKPGVVPDAVEWER